MEIYCGLCGLKAHELFSHLREVHRMEPQHYVQRCQGAPLVSEELSAWLLENGVRACGEGVFRRVELFGVDFEVPVLPPQMVPHIEHQYVFDERLARQLLISLKEGEKVLLVGETGCGKSTLIEQLAARLNWPVVRVAASGGLTESDLLGEWTVREGQTVFNYGFLPRAMRMGAICLIDEIDGIEPSVAFSIHQLMEDQGKLVLLQNGGEVIEPAGRFRLVTTANTLGDGDDAGLYAGTRVLNAAFLDRFASVFRMSYLAPSLEAQIIRSRAPGCAASLAGKLVQVASDLREAHRNGQLCCILSTRRLIEVARKSVQLDGDLSCALETALLSRLHRDDRQVVQETFQRHLGPMLQEKESEHESDGP